MMNKIVLALAIMTTTGAIFANTFSLAHAQLRIGPGGTNTHTQSSGLGTGLATHVHPFPDDASKALASPSQGHAPPPGLDTQSGHGLGSDDIACWLLDTC